MKCVSCGTESVPAAKFCVDCGAALPQASARFASPEVYTPRHLADRILTSRGAIEGERKLVTVLFADLEDSLEQIARRDPEEASQLLDPVLSRMVDAVHRYEGTVNQVMGDGIMALFGAPVAHEDHAVRACYAALRMQETVGAFAREVRSASGAQIRLRVGVNSGQVVVRSLGSDLRMDYTAVGLTTHLAARLEKMATPGTILIAPETRDLVTGYVRLKPLGPVPIRGMPEPVEVFEVVEAEVTRSRVHAQAVASLSRFVGRMAELARLETALNRARHDQGQIVALVAAAGIGKSRLYWEFLRSSHTRGCRTLEAACVAYLRTTAYRPIVELVRMLLGIDERDGQTAIRTKIAAALAAEPQLRAMATPPLLWLLDVPVDDPEWVDIDPEQRRQRVVDGVKGILAWESRRQPLIIVVEDIHWADAETQKLLDALVESLPALAVLLLVSFRPDYRNRWVHRSYSHELRVDPLAPESATELLRDLVGTDPGLDPLKRLLVTRAEGNPFFLEEMVKALRETGVLAGDRGACRLTQAIHTIDVPPTVQAILAARVDRLADADKRLLQSASIVGPEVTVALLEAIVEGGDEHAVQAGLARLRDAEFLYESRLYPELVHSFRHTLTHDVVYDGVLLERRRVLHGKLVGAIERLHAGRLAEYVDRLAHHALRGEQWGPAIDYGRQAAARARARAANHEAVGWLEQAVTALAHLPETPNTLALSVDVRLELRGALYALGEFDGMLAAIHEAERVAMMLGDPRRLGWVAFHRGESLRLAGRLTEAREHLERARATADQLRDLPLQVAANQYLGLTRHALGDYVGAVANMETVVSLPLEQVDAADFSHSLAASRAGFRAVSTAWLARCLAETGTFNAALTFGRGALRAAEDLGHPYPIAFTRWALGSVYALRADFTEADALMSAALTGAEAASLTVVLPQVMRTLGWVRAMVGRIDEGLDLLTRALSVAESMRIDVAYPAIWGQLGEVHLLAGRGEPAERFARLAVDRARTAGQRGDEARALRLLGDVMAARDPLDAAGAEQAYRDALALAEAAEMRPLIMRCHLDLGRLFNRTGKPDIATRHITTARDLSIAMGLAVAGIDRAT